MIKEKDLVFILSSSAIVTFMWIGSTLYHAFVTSTIEEPLTTFIKPISAHFNTAAIEKITNRNETVPTYELSGTRSTRPSLTPASSPSASVNLQAENLPNITPTPSSSEEGASNL